jgi:GNAT superfamily N-acetyltransferase
MRLRFTSPHDQQPGVIASVLKRSYDHLAESDPKHWGPEVMKWEDFDREVFKHPDTIGSCVFLSWSGDQLVGFGSYDPRQKPALGVVGHNCILPEFRGRGFGKKQIREILRRFQTQGIRRAKVSTGAHPFFVPAQRMYTACGFQETGRHPSDGDPSQDAIEYEMELANQRFQAIGDPEGELGTRKIRQVNCCWKGACDDSHE